MIDDNFDLTPDPPEPTPSPWRNCLMTLITVLVIVGLLGSSIMGVLWLVHSRLEARQLTETVNPAIPTLAASPRLQAEAGPTAVPLPPLSAADRLNRLVYVTTDGHIATMNPNGSDGRILTETRRNYLFPAWSPVGNDIAVIGNGRREAAIVYLQDSEEAAERTLYASSEQPAIYLYWSPNGRQLSFIASDADDGLELHIASLNEEAESRVLANGQPFYWQWTADAEQLFIHSGFQGSEARLTLLDAAGEGEGENIAAPGSFQSPGISADGRYWAYAEEVAAGTSWLVVADTQSGELHRERHGGQIAMGWSPTANQLAFISGSEEDGRFFGPLRLLDVATGETTMLSREVVLAFFWSPDGRYLAYFTAHSGSNSDLQAAMRQRLAKPAQQFSLQFGLSVVDVTTGEGLRLAEFTPTFIFLSQFLPFFDQYALSHRLWSPDSNALVLPMQVQDEPHIFVVPVGGGQPQDIAVGDMAFWSQR
ncbi:MAG: PD40 domain-containing protein [Ardenticatenaceae bacterium]|nr:PD40 domain-containing protein [Ardenticatenaceae bacterium]